MWAIFACHLGFTLRFPTKSPKRVKFACVLAKYGSHLHPAKGLFKAAHVPTHDVPTVGALRQDLHLPPDGRGVGCGEMRRPGWENSL